MKGDFMPRKVTAETRIRIKPPAIYKELWYLKRSFEIIATPKTAGKSTAAIPRPKIKVIKSTFSFSLKTLPRYAGRRKVIQHGAKRATIPATNDAINDV